MMQQLVMSNKENSDTRKKHIRFIFQNYNLVALLKVMNNILFFIKLNKKDIEQKRRNRCNYSGLMNW